MEFFTAIGGAVAGVFGWVSEMDHTILGVISIIVTAVIVIRKIWG